MKRKFAGDDRNVKLYWLYGPSRKSIKELLQHSYCLDCDQHTFMHRHSYFFLTQRSIPLKTCLMQQLGYKAAMHKFREWHCNLKLPSNCTRNILLVSVKNTFLFLGLTKHFIFQFNYNKGSISLELKHLDHFV